MIVGVVLREQVANERLLLQGKHMVPRRGGVGDDRSTGRLHLVREVVDEAYGVSADRTASDTHVGWEPNNLPLIDGEFFLNWPLAFILFLSLRLAGSDR